MIRNVFYGVMLDTLILLKIIQEELKKLIERLLVILNYDRIEFPEEEKDF